MFKVTLEQHAQILGWTIIGYGLSFIYAAILPMLQMASVLDKNGNTATLGQLLWPTILGNIVIAVICFIAGNAVRYVEARPKSEGLLFAVASFGFFPLGSILSLYTLVYLFVIYPEENSPSANEINE